MLQSMGLQRVDPMDMTEQLKNNNQPLQTPPETKACLSGFLPASVRVNNLPSVSVLPFSWKALRPRPEFVTIFPAGPESPLLSLFCCLYFLCLQTLNLSDPLGVDPAPMF